MTVVLRQSLDLRLCIANGPQVKLIGTLRQLGNPGIMERIKGRALKEGRADDASEDIINNRIETYHNQTEPLIAYYTNAGKYHEIDGVGTIDEVRDRIFAEMDKK